jgi:hypothetical protein
MRDQSCKLLTMLDAVVGNLQLGGDPLDLTSPFSSARGGAVITAGALGTA